MDRAVSFFASGASRCYWPSGYLARGGAFSPAQLPGLVLWYDAQNAASLTGDPVSQWNDAGPGGRTLTQGAAANRPGLQSGLAGFGGRSGLEFHPGDSGDQAWLQRSGDALTSDTSGTVWVVAALGAAGDRVVLAVSHDSSTQRYWQVQARNVAGETRWAVNYRNGGVGSEAGVYAAGAEGLLAAEQAYLLTASSDGDSYRLWIDGRAFGGGGPGSLGTIGALGNNGSWVGDVVSRDRLALAARLFADAPVQTAGASLTVAEVVMTAPEAADGAIQQMHAYLAQRYAIALAP